MISFRLVNSQEFHGNPTIADPLLAVDARTGLIPGRKSLDLEAAGYGWRLSATVRPEPGQPPDMNRMVLLGALREVIAQIEATVER